MRAAALGEASSAATRLLPASLGDVAGASTHEVASLATILPPPPPANPGSEDSKDLYALGEMCWPLLSVTVIFCMLYLFVNGMKTWPLLTDFCSTKCNTFFRGCLYRPDVDDEKEKKAKEEDGDCVAGAEGTQQDLLSGVLPKDQRAMCLGSDGRTCGLSNSVFCDVRDFLICAAGFLGSMSLYSYYQEYSMVSLFKNAEHPEGERFTSSSCATVLNRSFTLVLAWVILAFVRITSRFGWFGGPERAPRRLPIWEYAIGAYTNNISSVAQSSSLHFISFPLLVLSKVCKMIPMMIVNGVIFRRGYTTFEWAGAVVVVVGAFLFVMNYQKDDDQHVTTTSTVGGVWLLLLYLGSDAYTSSWQGATYRQNTSILPMLIWLNTWAVVISFFSTVTTPDIIEALGFFQRNPSFFGDLCVLSIASASGQIFILITIARFGPLAYAALATVRQLLSTIVSIVMFHHHIKAVQIIGLLLVFFALGSISYLRFRMKQGGGAKKAEKEGATDEPKASTSFLTSLTEGAAFKWLTCNINLHKLVLCSWCFGDVKEDDPSCCAKREKSGGSEEEAEAASASSKDP